MRALTPVPASPADTADAAAVSSAFPDWRDLVVALRGHGYVADDELAVVAHLATVLRRPLLLEGPAGDRKSVV